MTVLTDEVTPILGAPLAEYLAERIPKQARHSSYGYRRVPPEDFEQAMWLEVLTKVARFKEPFDKGELWIVNRRLKGAAGSVVREDIRYQRAVKAAEGGYSPDDEEFYSTGLLARLIPALISAEFDVADAMQRALSGTDAAGVHIHGSDPFSGAENYQVMLIDVARAWKRLPEGQRRLLRAYYGVRQDDTEDGRWERQQLASSMGLTAEALRQRVHRGLARLQQELGGADPWK